MGKKRLSLILGIAVLVLLILLPFYGSRYTITTFTRIIYLAFLALSVGTLVRQGGMISLTQTAFFGAAGYIIGLLGVERGWVFPLPELIAILGVLLMAFILGLVVMRTHGTVFLMLTLALGQICWAFARQNTSLLHGWAGIRGFRPFTVLGIDFTNPNNYYWGALALLLLGLFVMWLITNSPFGLALNGIRESPKRMASLGYPVYWLRVILFVITALYACVGGIISVYATGIITPTTIQMSRTILILLMVILGGSRYFWGPVVGAVIAVWLDVLISQMTPRYNTVIGLIFVAVVVLAPNGIIGLLDDIRNGVKLPQLKRWWNSISAKQSRDSSV